MPKFKTFKIPSDYSETETDWVMVSLCIPNTREWRGVVSGSIYNLTRGRNWDETTGIIKVAQVIGERIYNSMAIDCNNNWDRIATALESVDSKIPQLVTLQEFMDGLADSSVIAAIAEWLALGDSLASIIPNIDLKLSPVDWAKFWLDLLWKRRIGSAADQIAKYLQLTTIAETGETVAEGAEALDGIFDNISDYISLFLEGGTMGAEAIQAWAQIRSQYQQPEANFDLDLRNINRVYTDVFVDNQISVDMDCCPDGGEIGNYAGTQTITPGSGGVGGGPIIDSDASTNVPIDADKCNAAAYIVEQYIEYLKIYDGVAGLLAAGGPTGFAVWLNSTPLIFSSLAVAGSVLVLFGYVVGLLIAGIPLTVYLGIYVSNLESTKDALICDIVLLGNTPDAIRSLLETWMTDNLPSSMPSSWVTYHIEHLFPNNVVNEILDTSWDLGGFTHDCGECDEEYQTFSSSGFYQSPVESISQCPTLYGWNLEGQTYGWSVSDWNPTHTINYRTCAGVGLQYAVTTNLTGWRVRTTVATNYGPANEWITLPARSWYGASASTPFTVDILPPIT